ncbi:nucleotidyltransferase domain-containing protein [Halomonas sp. BM-2019]|uniref:nucleotidyltransferase domain-containing protein n=1 Tax=Halomonas sp. BM-2019 TaxID=2811227 RepID=UPI001B3C438F|nr:MAG: nucleotidyltransferase domain-containing protein [Halomonas sp. BM-2019]
MRLTREQRETIASCVREFAGVGSEVRVFGSRLDDSRRGGDLDILIITAQPLPRLTLADLKYALEQALYLPVDILNYPQGQPPTPFQAIALSQAQPLDDAA